MESMDFPDVDGPKNGLSVTDVGDYLALIVFEGKKFRAAWLDRPTVEVLRDWLTIWLEEER